MGGNKVMMMVVAILFMWQSLGFLISKWKNRSDVVDIFWGFGFFWVASFGFYKSHSYFGFNAPTILWLLVGVWAFRLSIFIGFRHQKQPEDERYVRLKASFGAFLDLKTYVYIFLFQGFLIGLISSTVLFGMLRENPVGFRFMLGFFVFLVGLIFETVSDYQLRQFKQQAKKGEILQTGLWRYCRHPNYFGEILLWWGIGVMAWHFIGPLVVTFLIRYVSGVPILEKKMAQNAQFLEYQKRTSCLIPWPPK